MWAASFTLAPLGAQAILYVPYGATTHRIILKEGGLTAANRSYFPITTEESSNKIETSTLRGGLGASANSKMRAISEKIRRRPILQLAKLHRSVRSAIAVVIT